MHYLTQGFFMHSVYTHPQKKDRGTESPRPFATAWPFHMHWSTHYMWLPWEAKHVGSTTGCGAALETCMKITETTLTHMPKAIVNTWYTWYCWNLIVLHASPRCFQIRANWSKKMKIPLSSLGTLQTTFRNSELFHAFFHHFLPSHFSHQELNFHAASPPSSIDLGQLGSQ